jgi:hypothetical protein
MAVRGRMWDCWFRLGRDPVMDVGALAGLAGTSLVTAVVTDAWEDVRHRIASWFGRGKPDPKTLERLDRTHAELTAAEPGKLARIRQHLAREWAGRFKDLIADHPDAAGELDDLVREIQASAAVASGHAVAAGRNMAITASGGVAAGVIHGDVSTGPTRPDPASS